MEAFLESLILIFFGEIGDKTQLLALVLTARYKRPLAVFSGIFIATLLNHLIAAWFGSWLSEFLSADYARYLISISFFIFAIWVLIPDEEKEVSSAMHWGPLLTTIVMFFMAEIGDKTQLATVALAAKYSSVGAVTVGSTLGLVISNALAVYVGHVFFKQIPMGLIRIVSALLFAISGIAVMVFY